MTYMTAAKNTQAEIIAEAKKITPAQREAAVQERMPKLVKLMSKTGIQHGVAVDKARFTLQSIDFSGKKTVVKNLCEPMPFYEFAEFMRNLEV